MIYKDAQKYPVNETLDGGDSAVRRGLMQMLGLNGVSSIESYEKASLLMRHPTQPPWNNPKNFTRDQMLPLIGGLYAARKTDVIRRVFWSRFKHFFFAQNTERDVPGSTKYPWPHTFTNDKGEKETRMFDFADPLFPDHISFLIKATGYKLLYPLMLPGMLWLWIALFIKRRRDNSQDELNQLFAQCYVMGPFWLRQFRELPKWRESLRSYWGKRNEEDYATAIIKFVDHF